jgi:hypothetical protein
VKIIASNPENVEAAKRLKGVIRSLVKQGFIKSKELPAIITEQEAVNLINNVVNGVLK